MKGFVVASVIALLLVAIAETHKGHPHQGRPFLCIKKLCDSAANSTGCGPCLREAHTSGSVEKEVLRPCFEAASGCFDISTEGLDTLRTCLSDASEVVGNCIAQ
nr:uncharacterized protein LOC113813734 [Penaeus vannamei]